MPLLAASFHNATLHEFLEWAQRVSLMPIYANADTPEDAKRARAAGATGIVYAVQNICSLLPNA